MTRDEVQLFLAAGARMDAIAARTSGYLQERLPAFADEFGRNQADEVQHAIALDRLSLGAPVFAGAPKFYEDVLRLGRVPVVLAVLNFIEERSLVQFRLAHRVTPHGDLLQIIADEHRHVALGREALRSLSPTPADLRAARYCVDRFDATLAPSLREGLGRVNASAFQRLQDAIGVEA